MKLRAKVLFAPRREIANAASRVRDQAVDRFERRLSASRLAGDVRDERFLHDERPRHATSTRDLVDLGEKLRRKAMGRDAHGGAV